VTDKIREFVIGPGEAARTITDISRLLGCTPQPIYTWIRYGLEAADGRGRIRLQAKRLGRAYILSSAQVSRFLLAAGRAIPEAMALDADRGASIVHEQEVDEVAL